MEWIFSYNSHDLVTELPERNTRTEELVEVTESQKQIPLSGFKMSSMVSSLNEKIKEFLLCLFVLSKGDGVLVVHVKRENTTCKSHFKLVFWAK